MLSEKQEKIIQLFIIALLIFIIGVQIGIHHGRELQKQEYIWEIYD